MLLLLLADCVDADVVPRENAVLTSGGEAVRAGETGKLVEVAEVATSAHAALDSEKYDPVVGTQEFFPEAIPSLLPSSSGVEDVSGLAVEEGALAMTERGGRMEKIWSSAGGGPYESNGSGTDWSIGSMIGSDLVYG